MSNHSTWLILSYKVPAEPSTLRVRVWRNLKELGVIYIQQSVCVAPALPEVQKKLEHIKSLIEENSGEALLLVVNQFEQITEKQLIDMLNEKRTLEYTEFLDGCQNFLSEIDMETNRRNYTFHEVEENEADLAKLKRWYRKILRRDFFKSDLMNPSKQKLDQCERILDEFTNKVYQSEGRLEGEISDD